MQKYAAEMIGTFALVFAGTAAVVVNSVVPGSVSSVGISLTFGLVVMAVIYSIGDISGAHLNPAVTLGFFFAGRLNPKLVAPYIFSQLVGAFVASFLVLELFGNRASLGATLPSGSIGQSFGLEIILTAVLMYVILCVSTGPKEIGVMAGIAIGGVIGLECLFAGPISGPSMNPARSLAPAILSGNMHALWIYMVAPVIGAAVAVPLWIGTRGYTTAPVVEAIVSK